MTDNSSSPSSDGSHQKSSLIDRLRSLFGLGGASIRDDIEDALDDTSTRDDFSPQERTMLKNVLGLHELRVADVMVPRADIIAISIDTSLAEVLAVFRTAGHSRLPVHAGTLDDPRGMVHIRDFVDHIAAVAEALPLSRRARSLSKNSDTATTAPKTDIQSVASSSGLDLSTHLSEANILRAVLFVPPSMPALDLLVKMQATRTHMALVIDEYGGTDGLVSIEDIVEMIVGDIEDEHDFDESPSIESSPDGSIIADARASLSAVSEVVEHDFTKFTDAEDVDTLGGLITTLAGRVPVRGEIIVSEGDYEFEVLDADPRRVKKIRILSRVKGQADK